MDNFNSLPKVSLIIPTFGRHEVLAQTVNYVFLQDYVNFEIILVDQTSAIWPDLESVRKRAPIEFRYIRLRVPNLPAARNEGIAHSDGSIVIFIDDDVEIPLDYIRNHVSVHLSDRSVGGVTGPILSPSEYRIHELRHKTSARGNLGVRESHTGTEVLWMSGCNMSYKREALIAAGLFDEKFSGSAWAEDFDMSLRIGAEGYRIVQDSRVRLSHLALEGGGCGNRNKDDRERIIRQQLNLFVYCLRKNHTSLSTTDLIKFMWKEYRRFALNRALLTIHSSAIFARNMYFMTTLLKSLRWPPPNASNKNNMFNVNHGH